jgi:hypothetical protein
MFDHQGCDKFFLFAFNIEDQKSWRFAGCGSASGFSVFSVSRKEKATFFYDMKNFIRNLNEGQVILELPPVATLDADPRSKCVSRVQSADSNPAIQKECGTIRIRNCRDTAGDGEVFLNYMFRISQGTGAMFWIKIILFLRLLSRY